MNPNRSHPSKWGVALLVATSLGGFFSCAVADQLTPLLADQGAPPAMPAQEQPEVLSRGPVHEAFAEPVNMQLQAGLLAPDRPPPNIEELPPEERPQGQQYVWIPGYWSWDADRHGYIWVSACWRVAPPRMSWVPGYWSQVSGGWEWIAGFWSPAGLREIEYLPAPPSDEDVEPLGPAPSQDTIWVPPCMYWAHGQYVRRSGYWLAAQPNWVWVPSHYIVTPRGYIFAEGHWDYSLERRGVLFAPVCFSRSVYGRSNILYSPSIVIDVGLLRVSLFAYPRYCHYFFGDYYDDAYLSIGIYPWFDSRRIHSWYDPVFEHDRWRHQRSEPRWEEHGRDDYNRRRADKDLRPARTFHEQESRLSRLPEPQRRALQVTQRLTVAAASRETPLKFERINTDARQKIAKQATAVRTFREDRNRWESTPESPKTVQPIKRQETVQPVKERNAPVTTPVKRQETVQPVKERDAPVTAPVKRQETVLPVKERDAPVTAPVKRQETVQPVKERDAPVTAPVKRQETVQPAKERGRTVTAPAVQREPAFVPPRESRVVQPERVQIPAPPIVGRSGSQGIFQKGAPARPDDEGRDKEGKDLRRK